MPKKRSSLKKWKTLEKLIGNREAIRTLRSFPGLESGEFGAVKVYDFSDSCQKEQAFDLSEVSRKKKTQKQV